MFLNKSLLILCFSLVLFPVWTLAYSPGQKKMDEGSMLYKQRKFQEAKLAFQEALKLDSSLLKAWENLGWSCYQLNNNDDALKIWKALLKIKPDDTSILNAIAKIYISTEEHEKAALYLKKSLDIFPKQRNTKMQLASEYSELNLYDNALTIYKDLINNDPFDKDSILQLARLYESTNRHSHALNLLQKHAKHQPTLIPYLVRLLKKLGDQYYRLEKYSKAEEKYKIGLKWNPNNSTLHENLGRVYQKQKKLNNSLEELKKALDLADKDNINMQGRILRLLGDVELENGHLSNAGSWYDRAIKINPQANRVLKKLGWAYWKKKEWPKCEKTWQQLATAFPDDPDPQALLTRLYLKTERYQLAEQAASSSLSKDMNQPIIAQLHIKALLNLDQFAAARKEIITLARRYPGDTKIQKLLGSLYMRYREYNLGKKQWRKVLAMEPESPIAQYYWIKCLYESGDSQLAVQKAKHAVTNPSTQFDHRLLVLLKNDAVYHSETERAVKWQKRILALAPDDITQWLELTNLFQQNSELEEAEATLSRAKAHFSNEYNFALRCAKARLELNQKATDKKTVQLLSYLHDVYPYNRPVYKMYLSALIANNQYEKALRLLTRNRSFLLNNYQVDLQRGRILRLQNKLDQANDNFQKLVTLARKNINVPILLYHGLSKESSAETHSIKTFEDQLKALSKAGYTTITISDLEAIRSGSMKSPQKPIIITFDDGRIDSFVLGDPLLLKYGMRAAMFVPTGDVKDNGPFFADWNMIRHYSATGRWDIQSHGHFAQHPITVNSSGHKGYFLPNLQWLEGKNRLETEQEYLNRIDNDYATSKSLLTKEVPGSHVVGLAVTFSEAGQMGATNQIKSAIFTLQQAQKYFNFAFLQNSSGYNLLLSEKNQATTFWRFAVPNTWDGTELLMHLAKQYPLYQAELELAITYYSAGQYKKAKRILKKWIDQQPELQNDISYHLAAIEYYEGNYRKSDRILDELIEQPSLRKNKNHILRLSERIQWKISPLAQIQTGHFSDKNDRENHWTTLLFRYPFNEPIDIYLGIGHNNFQENDDSIDGTEIIGGINWKINEKIGVKVEGSNRNFNKINSTDSHRISIQHNDAGKLILSISKHDIDTVKALSASVQADEYTIHYSRTLAYNLHYWFNSSFLQYDDDNDRIATHFNINYYFSTLPLWHFGLELGYDDTDKNSDLYYSPEKLKLGRPYVSFQKSYGNDWSFNALAGIGIAEDNINDLRPSGVIRCSLNKKWAKRWQAQLKFNYSQVPNYYGITSEAVLSYHF